jgi:hypothetical protein
MNAHRELSRRAALGALAATALWPRAACAATWPEMTVHKDPSCGCCGEWVRHLQAKGFAVKTVETATLNRLKTKLGIPSDLVACHTAEVDGYLVEGHVPAVAIERLLTERPQARGLAAPGMPSGSPGMGGEPETYDVILFGKAGRRVYGTFKGDKEA